MIAVCMVVTTGFLFLNGFYLTDHNIDNLFQMNAHLSLLYIILLLGLDTYLHWRNSTHTTDRVSNSVKHIQGRSQTFGGPMQSEIWRPLTNKNRIVLYVSYLASNQRVKLKSVELKHIFPKNPQKIIVLITQIDIINTSLASFTERSKKWCGGKCDKKLCNKGQFNIRTINEKRAI